MGLIYKHYVPCPRQASDPHNTYHRPLFQNSIYKNNRPTTMFAKFYRTFHTFQQNYLPLFEDVCDNSFGVVFAQGNRMLNI